MNDNKREYYTSKQVREKYGIADVTLRRLANQGKVTVHRSPGGKRFYDISSVFTAEGKPIKEEGKVKYAYCRVSSAKQKDDLERQKQFMLDKYPEHIIVADIGSGVNWKRLQFSKILAETIDGKVEELVIAHKDRLCRFNFELMEKIFKLCGTQLIILNNGNNEHKSTEQELAEDLLAIIHIFSCKEMGKRRYGERKEKNKNKNDKNISN